MRNGNGGVAIGYGYTANGQIDRVACSAFLWSSGEQLRKAMDPALIARLAARGPAIVDGLQGNAIGLVRPANVPPLQTYFVDYDDSFSDDSARGHLGDLAIWRICGQALAPLPLPMAVPFELIGGGGACRRGEFRLRDGRCCDRRDVRDGRCSSCPIDEIRLPAGQCCDRRYVRDGRCNSCPPRHRLPTAMLRSPKRARRPLQQCRDNQAAQRPCCDAKVRDGRNSCPRTRSSCPTASAAIADT